MIRQQKHLRVLGILMQNATQHGVDTIVEEPLDVILGRFKVEKPAALANIRKLEREGFLVSYSDGRGNAIFRVRLLLDRCKQAQIDEPRRHEYEEWERLALALKKFSRTSQRFSGARIVHSDDFHDVMGKAQIDTVKFYEILYKFEKEKSVEIAWKDTKRILLIILRDENKLLGSLQD